MASPMKQTSNIKTDADFSDKQKESKDSGFEDLHNNSSASQPTSEDSFPDEDKSTLSASGNICWQKIIKTNSIVEDYDVEWNKKLGTGISGPVRLCKKRDTSEQFALKCLLDNYKSRQEVRLHVTASNHDHIVQVYHVYANDVQFPGEDKARPRLLVVMEYMQGGELFDRISRKHHFTEFEASQYTKQIVSAISRCHSLNIAHRDVKPENLLLKDTSLDAVIKLSDFGFAKIDDGSLATPQFTPYYVAPQVLEAQYVQQMKKQNHFVQSSTYTYDKSCDLWSLGVIIYIMLCGYPPFYSETPSKTLSRAMKRKIMRGEFEFPPDEWNHISLDAKDMVRRLLHVDPEKRMTVAEVEQHPWLIQAPHTPLPTPKILFNEQLRVDNMKAAHSEALTSLRQPETHIQLKPIEQIQNNIIRKRRHSSTSEPHRKKVSSDLVGRTLKEIAALCADVQAGTIPKSDIAPLMKKCQDEWPDVMSEFEAEGWDGSEFSRGSVDWTNVANIANRLHQLPTGSR